MKSFIPKILIVLLLLGATIIAYGGSFYGWFLPRPLANPVSIRDGSVRAGAQGSSTYFRGGRSHYGGGYRGGK